MEEWRAGANVNDWNRKIYPVIEISVWMSWNGFPIGHSDHLDFDTSLAFLMNDYFFQKEEVVFPVDYVNSSPQSIAVAYRFSTKPVM